jgi:multicomponent Na+:H+ antiporter subunit G
MREIVVLGFMCTGGFFMLVAALGVLRMPDLFMRLSATTKASTLGACATTKASTLGACSLLLAAAVHFNDFGIGARITAIIAFIVMTAPVAAHMIGRAAYFSNEPLWKGTVIDELRGRYDLGEQCLKDPVGGGPPGEKKLR